MPVEHDKPKAYVRGPHYNYHQVIAYIETKYNISTRSYTPINGFTSEQLAKDPEPYLDFWHYVVDGVGLDHEGVIFLNLWGDYQKDKPPGDWDGDSEYRPHWVREIQKMIYDEFQPEDGEMKVWI